ncbi:hypothetical protein [Massilia alkalitolerans]|uniref:hypothetical protein n=1 Tax=Massilia alkalitolerans TaxID=286638 RepID=UPI0028AC29FB|nr:hypothetical protein [Massilia alkalitolerans]
MRNLGAILATMMLVAGCASEPTLGAKGIAAFKAGQYRQSEAYITAAIREGSEPGLNWHNLAILYNEVANNNRGNQHYAVYKEKAANCHNMAARYGVSASQQALINLNRPVPSADLKVAEAKADGDNFALLMLLGAVAASGKAHTPPAVNCTSMRLGQDLVHTQCK